MLDGLVAFIQSAALIFLAWGAYLCLFCRDRRTGPRTSAADRRGRLGPKMIDLALASKGRATDFEIGFRRPAPAEKLAA